MLAFLVLITSDIVVDGDHDGARGWLSQCCAQRLANMI